MEKIIDFPVIEDEKKESLIEILQALANHLNTTMEIKTVSLLQVKYDGNCHDMDVIIKQLAGDPAGIKAKKIYKRREITKPFRISDQMMEKDLDMLGS